MTSTFGLTFVLITGLSQAIPPGCVSILPPKVERTKADLPRPNRRTKCFLIVWKRVTGTPFYGVRCVGRLRKLLFVQAARLTRFYQRVTSGGDQGPRESARGHQPRPGSPQAAQGCPPGRSR